MGDLKLSGKLNIMGKLILRADSGTVKIDKNEILVEGAKGIAPSVLIPPPPSKPIDDGTEVLVINSLNKRVLIETQNAGASPIVTRGIAMQGHSRTWPGIVLPSINNMTVKINGQFINVMGDRAIIFASGGNATFKVSGQ